MRPYEWWRDAGVVAVAKASLEKGGRLCGREKEARCGWLTAKISWGLG